MYDIFILALGAVVGSSFGFVFFLLLSYQKKSFISFDFDIKSLERQQMHNIQSIRKLNKRLDNARF